jgi:hypothetical protein
MNPKPQGPSDPLNVFSLLNDLSVERPVFHSEADFQFSLAWKIKERYPEAIIRLEVKPNGLGTKEYLDILVFLNGRYYPIELKYKTKAAKVLFNNENFDLSAHAALDFGRYDFLKDVDRLQRFAQVYPQATGYAIMLTNDEGYWEHSDSLASDLAFRLHEGKELAGELSWQDGASANTLKHRAKSIALNKTYSLSWQDYATLPLHFKMLVLEVAE